MSLCWKSIFIYENMLKYNFKKHCVSQCNVINYLLHYMKCIFQKEPIKNLVL